MTKVSLVTGGAGFVGSHLCEELLERGHKVIAVDNYYTGSKRNIEHLLDHEKFSFYNMDVTSKLFTNTFSTMMIDYIFNLACPASPVHYQKEPINTLMTSVLGAKNCLDVARAVQARVVQASTSEVYGDPEVHPQPESYNGNVNTTGPRACYDEGKRAAETLFFDYKRKYNLDIGVFRIFNTYGPRMAKNDGRVVSNFIVNALADGPLEIHGAGLQTRSFCYVDDLVEGIIKFAFSNETGPINLGNPTEFTISELASIIRNKVGKKGYIVNIDRTIDDPQQRKPIIDLAKERLNWEPKVALSEGLDKTIEYFRRK